MSTTGDHGSVAGGHGVLRAGPSGSALLYSLRNSGGQVLTERAYSKSSPSTMRRPQPLWAHPGVNLTTFAHWHDDFTDNVITPREAEYYTKFNAKMSVAKQDIAKACGIDWISRNPIPFVRISRNWSNDLGLTVRDNVDLATCPEADRLAVEMNAEDLQKASAIQMVAYDSFERASNECQEYLVTDEKKLEALYDYLDPQVHSVRDLAASVNAQRTPDNEPLAFNDKYRFLVQQLTDVHGDGQGLPTVLYYMVERKDMATTVSSFVVLYVMRATSAHIPFGEANQRLELATAPWAFESLFDENLKKTASVSVIAHRCCVTELRCTEMADIITSTERTHQMVVAAALARNPHLIDTGDPSDSDPAASRTPAAAGTVILPKNSKGFSACIHCYAAGILRNQTDIKYHPQNRCTTLKHNKQKGLLSAQTAHGQHGGPANVALTAEQIISALTAGQTFTCHNCGAMGHRWIHCIHPLKPQFAQLKAERATAAADRVLARPAAGSLPANYPQRGGRGGGRARNNGSGAGNGNGRGNGGGRGNRGRGDLRHPNADKSAATLAALVSRGIISLEDVNSVMISQTSFESWSDEESCDLTGPPATVESVS